MVQQLNAKEVKEKIVKFLSEKGPSLPVQVAKYMGLNSIFASAFLSEMASDGMIKISDMKVGGSPLYYLPDKFPLLENFITSLGSKEREACQLLKEKQILEDISQSPAIRVALRSIKDFAIPFKKDEKVFWRYFLISEDDVRKKLEKPQEIIEKKIEIEQKEEKKKESGEEIEKIEKKAEQILEKQEEGAKELEKINKELEEKRKELEKINKELSIQKERPEESLKISKKLKAGKKIKIEDEFLNEIKPLFEKKQIVIINLESFDKKQVTARVKKDNQECLLIALNKKKVEEEDLIKAYKKAVQNNLPYLILSKGEASKKINETIIAYKKLIALEKLE
jgi:hypothetical protein